MVVAVSADLRRGALDELASGRWHRECCVGRRAGRGRSAPLPRPARARPRCAAQRRRPGRVRARYQRILIDEFQDTDPLQIEIAVLLASSRADIADRAGPTTRSPRPTQAGCSSWATRSSRSTASAARTSTSTTRRNTSSRIRRCTSPRTSEASRRSWVRERALQTLDGEPRRDGSARFTPLTPYIDDTTTPRAWLSWRRARSACSRDQAARSRRRRAGDRAGKARRVDGSRREDGRATPGGLPRHRGADADHARRLPALDMGSTRPASRSGSRAAS